MFPVLNRLRSERVLLQFQSMKPSNIPSLRCLASARFGWISRLRWSPSGDTLAICGGDGIAVYVQGFGESPTFRLREHAAPVKDIAFSPDGKLLASCSADTMILLYRLEAGNAQVATAIQGGRDAVGAIAFSPDGATLASGGADSTIRLWQVATGELTAVLDGHRDEVTALRFAGKGNCLFSAGRDGLIRSWDLNAGNRSVVGRHDDWVRQLALRLGRRELASASRDMTIGLWSLADRRESRRWSAHAGGADALAFSPDGQLLASGGRDNAIRIWDVDASQELRTLKAHSRPVLALDFNPAGTLLASGAGDNKVMLWAVRRAR
jgi:WD40 repeat protein